MAAYAAATCVGGVFQLVLAWYFGWRRWPAPISRSEARASGRKLLPFAVHFSIATTIMSATDVVIVLLLGHLSGPAAAAIFKVATLPVMIGALASVPVRLVLVNEQAKLVAARRYAEFKALLLRWSRIGASIAVPAGIAGWFLMPWLVPVMYGDDFKGAVDPARTLLIYACIFFAFSWTKTFPTVIGRPRLATGLSLVLLVVAVPITVIWSEYGADAAAVGVTIGAGLVSLGNIVVALRLNPRSFPGQTGDPVGVPTRTPPVRALERA
jgi:O-antigen/teichoic acid export membrane protein